MLRFVKVFGGVLVLRRIAAADVPALEAQTQVNPRIAHLHALFAFVLVRLPDLNRIEMCALFRH
jgi:hypothetical protein